MMGQEGGCVLNISLTPELEKLVQAHVASGQYNSASEVIREALRLMIQRDSLGRYYDQWLEAQIELGWQQAERGEMEPHSMDTIVSRILADR